MSRVNDLIAPVRSANDACLVNPSRNVRMAYIQIDDICEPAIKSLLQASIQNLTPVSRQHNGRDYSKGFLTRINEVRNATPGNHALHALLSRFGSRREKRNHFFHNQDLSGLTVTDEDCVRAFCDLHDLLEMLYGNVECFDIVLANPPFGGKEGARIQRSFPVPGNATELLFLQHIMKHVRRSADARAAALVPEGALFRGGAFAEVKRMLFDDFRVFAVIGLPLGAFAPYSDVKTAIRFFRRAEGSHMRNPQARNETWRYDLPLPAGLKKFSRGSPILDEHFAESRRLWERWKRWIDGAGERPFLLASEVRRRHRPEESPHAWVETLVTCALVGIT